MFPKNVLDPRSVFKFTEKNNRAESLTWRRFAPSDDDVHAIGASDVESRNVRRRAENKELQEYRGFIEAEAATLRSVQSARGHRVEITHEPSEGCHHAHITIIPSPNSPWKKNDQRDVADEVWKHFSAVREWHSAA